jgi:hypothetical protein
MSCTKAIRVAVLILCAAAGFYSVPQALSKDVAHCCCTTRAEFVGKWEAAQGNGQSFFITLYDDGRAWKSSGPGDGTWKWIDGEARISWDDGWHDAIVKIGSGDRHLKLGYQPGKDFEGTPSNVGPARNVAPAR